jgi:hypothetical protein
MKQSVQPSVRGIYKQLEDSRRGMLEPGPAKQIPLSNLINIHKVLMKKMVYKPRIERFPKNYQSLKMKITKMKLL